MKELDRIAGRMKSKAEEIKKSAAQMTAEADELIKRIEAGDHNQMFYGYRDFESSTGRAVKASMELHQEFGKLQGYLMAEEESRQAITDFVAKQNEGG